nr:MauE/DoxX family redox-associated membrane protein [Pedobacter psychroterrae]
MSKSPIITDFASILAWMIPSLEIVISIMLFAGWMRLLGLYASLALMSLFTAYIYAILKFSDTVPCSCGGILEKMGWKEHLIFNIVFVVLAIIGIVLKTKIEEKNRAQER